MTEWEHGTAIRWQNRGRWWYGVVLWQKGNEVTIKETAKGEERPGGKIGTRHAEMIERDPDPPTDGYYSKESLRDSLIVACVDCGAHRSGVVDECFCGETRTRPAPRPRRDVLERYRVKEESVES